MVARVVGKRPHPDAAKLTLVDVDDGSGKATQVVCGAPNVPDAGGLVLWARPGATLPNGVTLGEKPVRGIVSPGMLCAEDELGLGTSHAGIIILSPDDGLAAGDDLARKLGLPDEVFEVNVTPNRPDALGHVGIAREVAALVGGKLRLPAIPPLPKGGAPAKVEVVDVEGCPRFCAVAVDGVTVRPSPLAVRVRLQALGVRAISNVVDATNLTMLLWSQPVHAYDRDKLAGGGLIVRRAKAGRAHRHARRRQAHARARRRRHLRRQRRRRHRRRHGRRVERSLRRHDEAPARVRELLAVARAAHRQAARPAQRGVASLRARHRSQRLRRRRAPPDRDGAGSSPAAKSRARSPTSIRARSRRKTLELRPARTEAVLGAPSAARSCRRTCSPPSGSTPSTKAPDTFASRCRRSGPI